MLDLEIQYMDSNTIFIILALYGTTLDFKWNIQDEIQVQTFSFNLRVFTSNLEEGFRNYKKFSSIFPLFQGTVSEPYCTLQKLKVMLVLVHTSQKLSQNSALTDYNEVH